MNRALIFLNILHQNNHFLGNGWPSKIRLLQSYEVLWIHVIDAICRYTVVPRYSDSFRQHLGKNVNLITTVQYLKTLDFLAYLG